MLLFLLFEQTLLPLQLVDREGLRCWLVHRSTDLVCTSLSVSSGEGLVFGDLRAAHAQLLYRQQVAQEERKQKKVSTRGCFDSDFFLIRKTTMVDVSFQIFRRCMSMILANPTFLCIRIFYV